VSRARCGILHAASQNRDRPKDNSLVMRGLDPRIHVLLSSSVKRRGWPGRPGHDESCVADGPALQRTAMRCGERKLQIGRSRHCECMPIPARLPCLILLVSCPVRGASRGDPEVGQSESWPEGQPEGRCGARGCVSQTQTRGALGNRPCPLRGAAFNGWTRRVKGGETCLDGELARARARKNRSQGRRSRRDGASEGRSFYYQGASFGAPSPLKRGDQLKLNLARRRENAKPWLFEILNLKICMPRVPGAMRHSSCRFAEPGPYQTPGALLRPRLCSAPLREELRAALRPGNAPIAGTSEGAENYSRPNCRFSSVLARCSRSRCVFGNVLPARLT
jgi:hypothetical protein